MFLRIEDNKSIPIISIKNVELMHFELPVGVFKFETTDGVHVIGVKDASRLEMFLSRFDFIKEYEEVRKFQYEKHYKTSDGR